MKIVAMGSFVIPVSGDIIIVMNTMKPTLLQSVDDSRLLCGCTSDMAALFDVSDSFRSSQTIV